MRKLFLAFTLFITVVGATAQSNGCGLHWAGINNALSTNEGAVMYDVQYASRSNCGWPKVALEHTFPFKVSLSITLRGTDWDGKSSDGSFSGEINPNIRYVGQGNWHLFKRVTQVMKVEVSYYKGNDRYEILYDRARGINRITVNGKVISGNSAGGIQGNPTNSSNISYGSEGSSGVHSNNRPYAMGNSGGGNEAVPANVSSNGSLPNRIDPDNFYNVGMTPLSGTGNSSVYTQTNGQTISHTNNTSQLVNNFNAIYKDAFTRAVTLLQQSPSNDNTAVIRAKSALEAIKQDFQAELNKGSRKNLQTLQALLNQLKRSSDHIDDLVAQRSRNGQRENPPLNLKVPAVGSNIATVNTQQQQLAQLQTFQNDLSAQMAANNARINAESQAFANGFTTGFQQYQQELDQQNDRLTQLHGEVEDSKSGVADKLSSAFSQLMGIQATGTPPASPKQGNTSQSTTLTGIVKSPVKPEAAPGISSATDCQATVEKAWKNSTEYKAYQQNPTNANASDCKAKLIELTIQNCSNFYSDTALNGLRKIAQNERNTAKSLRESD